LSITELLDIQYPILKGVMALISTHKIVAAVSESGGLGVLSSINLEAEELREEIRLTRTLTSKPIAVNIMMLSKNRDQQIKVIIEENIRIITVSAGSPVIYMDWLKENCIKVIPVVHTVQKAMEMERIGVDAIIAEGSESGGYIGESSTMTLIPQVVSHVNVPVIAAGGIADGRGLAAALALGADGVQMGTRFLASEECAIPPGIKSALLKATDTSTIVTGRKKGDAIRSLKNEMLEKYVDLEFSETQEANLDELTIGSYKRAVIDGNIETGSLMTGQIAGLITEIKPAKDIVEEVMHEAHDVIKSLKI
jgi:enoyl-[acyl-carrier protein] reductase II